MEWKKYFDGKILSRGLDYYNSNAVRIINSSTSSVDAQVAGSSVYDVRINFKGSVISSMYCGCPYEGYCKHLAATFYYIDEHGELLDEHDYMDLLMSLTHGETIEFLSEELSRNADLRNKLKLFKNQDADSQYYFNKLNDCFDDPFKVLKFIDDDLYDLNRAKQIDLICSLSKSIVKYAEGLHVYGASDEIILKIDDLMDRLARSGFEKEVCEFLEEFILSSDDESVQDLFTDTYSRFASVEKLFDEHFG